MANYYLNYVMVLPYIYKPYFRECRSGIQIPDSRILAIDNTKNNRGVAESWNLGFDFMLQRQSDWLIIVSAAVRFGGMGGLDILQQLDKHPNAQIIHFAQAHIPEQEYTGALEPTYADGAFYWHLTAIRRDVFDKVGYFDPNYFPIYFEDTDFDLRVRKVMPRAKRLILPIDAKSSTLAHAVHLAGLIAPAEPNIAYFATKFGTHPNAVLKLNTYNHPFDDSTKTWKYFPAKNGREWNKQNDLSSVRQT